MAKKVIIGIILAVLLIAGIVGYNAYQNYVVKDLQVGLSKVSLNEITLSTTTIGVTLQVYNPSIVTAKVGSLEAGLAANGVPLARLKEAGFDVPPKQSVERDFNIKLSNIDLGLSLINAIKNRQISWQVKGNYTMDLLFSHYMKEFDLVS